MYLVGYKGKGTNVGEVVKFCRRYGQVLSEKWSNFVGESGKRIMLEKYVGTTVVVGDVGKIKMSENWEQSLCRRIGHNNFVGGTSII